MGYVQLANRYSYSFKSVFFSIDSNDLSRGFMQNLVMFNVFFFEHGFVLDISWFINSSLDESCLGSVTSLAVCLAKHVLTFNAWNITTVTYTTN